MRNLIILALLYLLCSSCTKTEPVARRPIIRRVAPKIIEAILLEPSPSSSVSSLADEPPSGSAPSTEPEGSYKLAAEHFDQQHLIVSLQCEIDDLKARNDLLQTELDLYKKPKAVQQVYRAPVSCAGGNCLPQNSNTYQRRGIFGWRR